MSMEELYIRNIENGIRGIRLGTKTPADANVGSPLNKLKSLNPGMHEDLMTKYKNVLAEYEKKVK